MEHCVVRHVPQGEALGVVAVVRVVDLRSEHPVVDRIVCPGRKPPKRAVKRPARPYKSPYKIDFHREKLRNAKGA